MQITNKTSFAKVLLRDKDNNMLDKKMKLMTLINLNKIRIQEDEWML